MKIDSSLHLAILFGLQLVIQGVIIWAIIPSEWKSSLKSLFGEEGE